MNLGELIKALVEVNNSIGPNARVYLGVEEYEADLINEVRVNDGRKAVTIYGKQMSMKSLWKND